MQSWVNHNYLQKLHIPEYHIYDSDNAGAHVRDRDRVNARGDGSSARVTQKREMENYIHKEAIREEFGVEIDIDDTMDVSTSISALIRATNPEGYNPDTVKKKLNNRAVRRMTIDRLKERDPEDEVVGWLRDITQILQQDGT